MRYLIIIVILFVFGCKNKVENKQEIDIKETEEIQEVKYVYDTSYILNKEEQAKLELLLKKISLEKNIEVVFCSVDNEEKESIDTVANKYFHSFDLRKNNYQNRILIIISTITRDFKISVGDNIDESISKDKLLEIKEGTLGYFKESKFYEGLNFAYNRLNDELPKML
ncbi:TPM domain-containing protein [Psychroserpens damuponensis]|uniref:TPM domain-containing protein n=1 Tax=Psychroserpens damuponensis TaxID=943936 RepID=UPI00058CD99E|nr:TPM domain-containing protein [Psychroserpens damuponensis]